MLKDLEIIIQSTNIGISLRSLKSFLTLLLVNGPPVTATTGTLGATLTSSEEVRASCQDTSIQA